MALCSPSPLPRPQSGFFVSASVAGGPGAALDRLSLCDGLGGCLVGLLDHFLRAFCVCIRLCLIACLGRLRFR